MDWTRSAFSGSLDFSGVWSGGLAIRVLAVVALPHDGTWWIPSAAGIQGHRFRAIRPTPI